ncbi:MAG: phosphate-starvation-inducible PsiE family protein [Gammaproteobacteria bacterium]|jgi:uncharacterized membrane protein (DUF373 family)
MKELIMRIYDRAIDVIVIGLVLVMIVVMVFAFFDVLLNMWHLIPSLKSKAVNEAEFRDMIVNVLDVFVIIELFNTFTGYVKTRRVRLTQLLDVTVVFALRELLAKLYANVFSTEQLIGLCIIVILLVLARSLTGRMSPRSAG